jgi:peptidoglycan-associated lipoprotein
MVRGSTVRSALVVAGLLALTLPGCQSSGTDTKKGAAPTGSEFDQGAVSGRSSGAEGASILEAVYFDYDRSDIRADAKTTLRNNAAQIKQHSEWGVVVVAGNADERGSEEYNLALGERRANAVKRYLVDLGISSSRLRTVSFGEAKPAVVGHDESAWRYNRRAEFKAGS